MERKKVEEEEALFIEEVEALSDLLLLTIRHLLTSFVSLGAYASSTTT